MSNLLLNIRRGSTPFYRRIRQFVRGVLGFHVPVTRLLRRHTRIHLGRKVRILGKVGIASGRMFDEPTLRIGDLVIIGHDVRFSVNREVCIEDGVFIAGPSTIADNDGHPHNPDLRVRGEPPALADIRPVRICRRAWIGQGAQIRKGVTVGEGAIVGGEQRRGEGRARALDRAGRARTGDGFRAERVSPAR
jgi:acetyltransferase-like isoleucine patch superfamily enzyme